MMKTESYTGTQSALERKFIEQYLNSRGYRSEDLKDLPAPLSRRLITEASRYASLKLAEIESKARFRRTIKGS